MEIGATGPDSDQRRCDVLVSHCHLATQEPLLLLGIHIEHTCDPQRVGAEFVLVHELIWEAGEFVGLRLCLLEVAMTAGAGFHEDCVASIGLLLGDISDERIPRRGQRLEVFRNTLLEHLTGIGVIGAEMVAADRHRIGHVGDVAGKAPIDIEALAFRAGGLVFVVGPGLGFEKGDQRHLSLDLLRVAAAVVGHEEFVVAEQARLDAVGPDHGHEDPKEIGGIDEEAGQILRKQEARARPAAGRRVLMESLEVEECIGNALREPWLGVTWIGIREEHG